MLNIKTIQHIDFQKGEGRKLRYILRPDNLMDNVPFIILADDKFVHNTFADHPHKGIQTVTYVLEGEVEVNGQAIHTFDVVHFDNAKQDDKITFSASAHAKFVVFASEPIKAPVVARDPFVMNTEQKILEAFESYHNGLFLDGKPY